MIIFRNYDKIPEFMKNDEIMMSGSPDVKLTLNEGGSRGNTES